MSKLTGIVSAQALVLFCFAAYSLNNISDQADMSDSHRREHAKYGSLRFLTYQTLVMQLINALLHFIASFAPSFRKPRDLVHTALAYPLAMFVASTFWTVYHLNRELIFPKRFDSFFPSWLNHSVHTAIVFINLLYMLLEKHKYRHGGLFLTLAHLVSYLSFLVYIKLQTTHYVYPYLDVMSLHVQAFYFILSAGAIALIYLTGFYAEKIINSGCCSSSQQQTKAKKKV